MRIRKFALDVFKHGAPPLLLLMGVASAQATEMVYYPVNPNFGGSPLNGATLLSQAQAQNKTKDPELDNGKMSPLEQLNDSVQRVVIGRLAAAISGNIVGDDGLKEGKADISGLLITVTKNPDGTFRIFAMEKSSGKVLEIEL
jgi:curli production assembly/transport component CsgF